LSAILFLFCLQGTDINEQDVEGRTPLMYAVQMNQMEAARLLVGKGCNISQKSCGILSWGAPGLLANPLVYLAI
jgi:ankyrin repeat protein